MAVISGGSGGVGSLSLLGSTTLASAAATVDVSNLSCAGYSGLMIVYGAIRSSASALSDTMHLRLNNDSGASEYGMSAGAGVTGGFSTSFNMLVGATSSGIVPAGGYIWLTGRTHPVFCVGLHGARTNNVGSAGDFAAPGWQGYWGGGTLASLTEVTLSLATGPNFAADAYLNIYGLA